MTTAVDNLADLDQLIRASQTDHRVDVVGLAKQLGIDVYAVDLPDKHSGSIKCDPDDRSCVIEVNRNHPLTRQRFTIAHELGHFLRHKDKLQQKGQLDRSADFSKEVELRLESEADQAAADILMPAYMVQGFFRTRDWDDGTQLDSAQIDELADQFRVSRAMAVTRLRELGIPVAYESFA